MRRNGTTPPTTGAAAVKLKWYSPYATHNREIVKMSPEEAASTLKSHRWYVDKERARFAKMKVKVSSTVEKSWKAWEKGLMKRAGEGEAPQPTNGKAWAQMFFTRHPKLKRWSGLVVKDKMTGSSSGHGEARQHGDEIWLFPKFWKLPDGVRDFVFAHEIGHWVLSDYSTAKFIKLAATFGVDVWEQMDLPFGQFNMDEAFADSFASYYTDGDVRKRYPGWTKIVATIVGDRKETAVKTPAKKRSGKVKVRGYERRYPLKKNGVRKSKIDRRHTERYKKWHWGIGPSRVINWADDDFPAHMIEIGRLWELHMKVPGDGEKYKIEVEHPFKDRNYLVFDADHKKQRMYAVLVPAVRRKLQGWFRDLHAPTMALTALARLAGGHHQGDYPRVQVKDLGAITDVVYRTWKKGDDDDGDPPGSGYIHKLGEEGGKIPRLGVDATGRLWIAGGDYTCPVPGITN